MERADLPHRSMTLAFQRPAVATASARSRSGALSASEAIAVSARSIARRD
jgi:hypothetical protein